MASRACRVGSSSGGTSEMQAWLLRHDASWPLKHHDFSIRSTMRGPPYVLNIRDLVQRVAPGSAWSRM
eukprot:2913491-Prorocentrum_lima.AAC.1